MGQRFESDRPRRDLPPVAPPPRKVSQPSNGIPEMSVFRGLGGPPSAGPNGARPGSEPGFGPLPAVSPPPGRPGNLPPVSAPLKKPSQGTLVGVGRPPPPRQSRDPHSDSITNVKANGAYPETNSASRDFQARVPAPVSSRDDSGEIVGLDWDEEEESTHVFPSSHPPSHDSGSNGMRASSRDMSKRPAPSNVDYSKPPSTDTLRLDGVDASPPALTKASSMFPPPPPIPSITQARPMESSAPGIAQAALSRSVVPSFPSPQIIEQAPLPEQPEEVRDQAFVRLPHGNPHTATELAIKRPVMPAFGAASSAPPIAAPAEAGAKKWMLGAAAAFALLSIAALGTYLFTRRPGSVQIDVRDAAGASVPRAEVFVDGSPVCNATPCLVRDLDTGRHSVRVIVPNSPVAIEPKTIEVEAGSVANVSFTLEAAQTTLVVASSQSGVRISVDGVDRGLLPARLTGLSAGRHEVKLSGDRYKPVERTVELKAGETFDLGEQKLAVAKGRLTLAVKGEGVSITLVPDGTGGRGKALDPPFSTPIEIDTSTGNWRVVAKKADNPDFSQLVDFSDGVAEKTVTVDFSSKQPEAISLNDLPSSTPSANATTTATSGKQAPPTSSPPPTRTSEPVEAASGSGTLNINSIPASRVLLDGQPLGETPRTGVSVSPGTHTVTFIHPELGKKSISVKVGAGETKSAVAKLRTD